MIAFYHSPLTTDTMHTLIDGYNLLNAAAIPSRGFGIGSLERSRLGLLHFLVETLDPAELARTTVVFDAQDAPPGLPRTLEYHGLSIEFAARRQTADERIAELIQADSSPRRLTVVSSDHQIQRAARRRKARAVDSDVWYEEVVRSHSARLNAAPQLPAKPRAPLPQPEVARWLEQFGGEAVVQQVAREEQSGSRSESGEKPVDMENPFPPGYGEDLQIDDRP